MKKIKMADFASSVLQILGLKEWKTENDKRRWTKPTSRS